MPAPPCGTTSSCVIALHCDKAVQEAAFPRRWPVQLVVGGPGVALGEEAEALRWLAFVTSRGRVGCLVSGLEGAAGADLRGARHCGVTGRSRRMFEEACLRGTRRASECLALARLQLHVGRSILAVQPWRSVFCAAAPARVEDDAGERRPETGLQVDAARSPEPPVAEVERGCRWPTRLPPVGSAAL